MKPQTEPPAESESKSKPQAASATRPAQKSSAARARTPKQKLRQRGPHASSREAPTKLPADFPSTRYLFFGGKGGVGKTTAAAATALALLDSARAGERVLLFSTDPAHSLSDSLGTRVGDRTTEVARRGAGEKAARLFAREMDAARALAEFKQRHRTVLAEIADRGTILDEADINDLLGLSLPGMDEVMALFELSEVERASVYARIVVDTAPSGHTSRMLRLPEVFARWVGALDLMSEKHRYMLAHFVRGRAPREDEVDLFLRELAGRVEAVRSMLFDPARASFVLVATPEALAFEESARYFRTLRDEGIPVTHLLINRVERAHASCPFCRARARMQSRWLRALTREFKSLRARRVPLFPQEVRGPAPLREFARAVWMHEADGGTAGRADAEMGGCGDGETEGSARVRGKILSPRHAVAPSAHSAQSSGHQVAPSPRRPVSPSAGFPLESKRLVIFGGKGGVGKTTAAASFALALAERDEGARVLVFSTDPAHSLSDSFGERVGELKRGVAGRLNLDAKEIDPASRFEELKERYRKWTDELFEELTGGSRFEVQFDREAMRELVSLAPPGIDEIAALSTISDLLDAGEYATIVLDTAPTGHLLRFLELPEVALAWVRTFLKLLLKYKNVVRWGGVAEELVALSKAIKRVASLLTDAGECEFVGVAIPERMSLEETARLAASLKKLKTPMRSLLINNLVTAEAARACDFCASRRRGQSAVVAEFRRRFARGVRIYAAPEHAEEVRGPEQLRRHLESWRNVT
ncbi:MAG TPA: ArsA family ATPase [Pyrinomonadaceae bacterium]|nr:ArsA family ATPase [Pyrinomonadaceae bacterium]